MTFNFFKISELPQQARWVSTLHADGDNLYLLGGQSPILEERFHSYSLSKKKWELLENEFTIKYTCRSAHISEKIDGKIYIFGGYDESDEDRGTLNDTCVYDISEQSFRTITTFTQPEKRLGHRSTVWNNKIFMFGGFHFVLYFPNFFLFDPKTNEWSQINFKGKVPPERTGHSMCIYKEKVYVFGGNLFTLVTRIRIHLSKTIYE